MNGQSHKRETTKVAVVCIVALSCLTSVVMSYLVVRALAKQSPQPDSNLQTKLAQIAQYLEIVEGTKSGAVEFRMLDRSKRERVRFEIADEHAGIKVLDQQGMPSISFGYEPYGASYMINGTEQRQGVLLQSDRDGARLLMLRGNVCKAELSMSTSNDGVLVLRDDLGVEQCSLWSTSQGVAICIGQREGPRSISLTYSTGTKDVVVRGKDGSVLWHQP